MKLDYKVIFIVLVIYALFGAAVGIYELYSVLVK
jgi:hypothetical protein